MPPNTKFEEFCVIQSNPERSRGGAEGSVSLDFGKKERILRLRCAPLRMTRAVGRCIYLAAACFLPPYTHIFNIPTNRNFLFFFVQAVERETRIFVCFVRRYTCLSATFADFAF